MIKHLGRFTWFCLWKALRRLQSAPVKCLTYKTLALEELTARSLFKKSLFYWCKFELWSTISGDWLNLIAKFSIPFCSKFYPLSINFRPIFIDFACERRYGVCEPPCQMSDISNKSESLIPSIQFTVQVFLKIFLNTELPKRTVQLSYQYSPVVLEWQKAFTLITLRTQKSFSFWIVRRFSF